MRRIVKWLGESNRYKHLAGGALIGAFAGSTYCAAYAGGLVAAALEFKDKAHGGKWDWIDFGVTVAGVAIGRFAAFTIL